MAKPNVTHLRVFLQEFSHRIPCLKEMRVWKRALLTSAHQIIRVILVISGVRRTVKCLDYAQRWGLPPRKPRPFLAIA